MYETSNKQENASDLDMMQYFLIFLLRLLLKHTYSSFKLLLFLEGNVMHGICQNASLFYSNEAANMTLSASAEIDCSQFKKCL